MPRRHQLKYCALRSSKFVPHPKLSRAFDRGTVILIKRKDGLGLKTSAFYSQKLQVGDLISGFARTLSKKRLKNFNIRENKLRRRQL